MAVEKALTSYIDELRRSLSQNHVSFHGLLLFFCFFSGGELAWDRKVWVFDLAPLAVGSDLALLVMVDQKTPQIS
jgi:hypothetical protein